MGEKDPFLKILLVCDDESTAEQIRSKLRETVQIDSDVKFCNNLADALTAIRDHGFQPDVIILNLGLIGTDSSREIFQKMEKEVTEIPIIALTGSAISEHDLAISVMEGGAEDVMVRGQFDRLIDAIQFALIRSQRFKEKIKELEHKDRIISWVSGGYSVEQTTETRKT